MSGSVIMNFIKNGEVVAIEILDVSKRADVSRILVESFKDVEVVG